MDPTCSLPTHYSVTSLTLCNFRIFPKYSEFSEKSSFPSLCHPLLYPSPTITLHKFGRMLQYSFRTYNNVLSASSHSKVIKHFESLEYSSREDGGIDFGVSWNEEGISKWVNEVMLQAARRDEYVNSCVRVSKNPFYRSFVTRMAFHPRGAKEGRPLSVPQFRWHSDGDGTVLLSWVYVTYIAPTSVQLDKGHHGGAVHYSITRLGKPSFHRARVSSGIGVYARPSAYKTYFPRPNSAYCLPGFHVWHAVSPVSTPSVVRFAYVAFLKVKPKLRLDGVPAPCRKVLLVTWAREVALLRHPKKSLEELFFCAVCFQSFVNRRSLKYHQSGSSCTGPLEHYVASGMALCFLAFLLHICIYAHTHTRTSSHLCILLFRFAVKNWPISCFFVADLVVPLAPLGKQRFLCLVRVSGCCC